MASATSIRVITVDFPNPEWDPIGSTNSVQQVNTSISFWYLPSQAPVTLSNAGAQPGNDVQGLLYVPNLPSDDSCNDAAAPYVPKNVTRLANLPRSGYPFVALAPWLSPDCVQKYLLSVKNGPGRALVFFLPDNSTAAPPNGDSPTWALGDGEHWKRENPFPVYAISGAAGNTLMTQSSLYSGNMTSVPHGHQLTEFFESTDYVRLIVDISTGGGSALPSLWVFLLVVLGILLGIIGCTSFSMHVLQRRRRIALRRRVANGEVDLEALGIKRLTVPQEVLDRMPLYEYGTGAPVAQPSTARDGATATSPSQPPLSSVAEHKLSTSTISRPSSPEPTVRPTPAVRAHSYRPTPLSQPTCAICLDDFIPASDEIPTGTIVRELPCHHIFHPECVDAFLRDSSSLCPMCKKSALPKGYCPRVVTNAMVRRERMMRDLRPDAEEGNQSAENTEEMRRPSRLMSWGGRLEGRGRLDSARRIFSAPTGTTEPPRADQEMQSMSPPALSARTGTGRLHSSLPRGRRSATQPVETSGSQQPQIQPDATPGRREWARERAVAMLGRDRAPLDPEAEEALSTPRWRKMLGTVFPGIGGRPS